MKKTTLIINGMMCGMCEAHVADVIRRNFDTEKITASHLKNTAVIISENALDEEKIKAVISATGYKIEDISVEDYEKKNIFSVFSRKKD